MKKEIHKAEERGKNKLDWLDSNFSFSFANYYNPRRMGFGKLVVLNDDIIAPGKGFNSHPHDNMEIITIVTEGELKHKDSTGVEEILVPGEVQVMSAGSGIVHSEYNNSKNQKLKLFQLWIDTKTQDIKPRHDKKEFKISENSLKLIVSGDKNNNALYINQNAKISLGKFEKGKETNYIPIKNNGAFIFVIEGRINVEGDELNKRDAIAISDIYSLNIKSLEESYFIIIDVPLS